jgi:hypothetical protein
LLLRLLELIPGVVGVGELHWLIDIPMGAGQVKTKEGYFVHRCCIVCEGDTTCPVFSPPFLKKRLNEHDLYQAVAEQASKIKPVRFLAVSDKSPRHYARFATEHEVLNIVLHKTSQNQALSDIKNEQRGAREAISNWTNLYVYAINRLGAERTIFVSLERLIDNPTQQLRRIATSWGLCDPEKIPEVTSLPTNYHHIGGSPRAHKSSAILKGGYIGRAEQRKAIESALKASPYAQQLREDLIGRSL